MLISMQVWMIWMMSQVIFTGETEEADEMEGDTEYEDEPSDM